MPALSQLFPYDQATLRMVEGMAEPGSASGESPLPPLVREILPVSHPLELIFLLVSLMAVLLAIASAVLGRNTLRERSLAKVKPLLKRTKGEDASDGLHPGAGHSPPGYDVIQDADYLRGITEAAANTSSDRPG